MQSELTFGSLTAWPLPIARALRQAEIADSDSRRYLHLLHAAEALLQLVGSVALLDAAAEGDPLKTLSDDRALHASTGLWRQCLDALLVKRKTPTIAGLRALRTDKIRWTQASGAIAALVDARNSQSHPIRVPSEAEAGARLPRLIDALQQALAHFSCLQDILLLRIHGEDPVSGRVRVAPLMGPESLNTPRSLRWPNAPAKDKIVAVDLVSDRFVVLAPLYRWHDRKLQAYLRTTATHAQWYAVEAPDRAPSALAVEETGWLARRLKTRDSVERGVLPNAQAVLGVETAPSMSAPMSAPMPTPTPARATAFVVGAPPRPRGDSRLASQAARIIVGFALIGLVVWGVIHTSADPDAQAAASSTRAPGDLIPATEPPTTVFKSLAAAYAAGDADAYHRHYLDNLECYYELTRHPTAKRVAGTRRGMRDRPKHYRQIDVIERSRRGPMAFIEERFQIAPLYKKAPPIMSRWYKLVQVEGFWRIAAEAGSHPNGEPCKCNYRLREEFGLPPPLKAAQTKRDR